MVLGFGQIPSPLRRGGARSQGGLPCLGSVQQARRLRKEQAKLLG